MTPLVLYPAEVLKQKCSPVTEFNEELRKFVRELETALYRYRGAGIAAPQLSNPIRIISLLVNNEATTFINPEIVEFGGNIFKTYEGCLSIPGMKAKLNCRHDLLHLVGRTIEDKKIEHHLMSAEAVAAQHECDHLEGITLFNRMGKAQRELKKNNYLKRIRKWKKKNKR